jgi:hypothetical protein
MTNEMLKLFSSEAEIKAYAKVNGYDSGATDKLIARWHTLNLEEEPTEEIINTVKKSYLLEQDMQIK